ncbi:MAG: hypothetical protein ABIT01_05995 [Thermoanaerobaculia bacterium]
MPEAFPRLTVAVGAPSPGRALYVDEQGTIYASRGYRVFRSEDRGASWTPDGTIPEAGWKRLASSSRLGSRLMRRQILALTVLADGARIAVGREGIYRAGPASDRFELTFRVVRGSRPLNLAVDDQGNVLFGEYGELGGEEVKIYVSSDGGRTFQAGFAFPRGAIRHVHNVIPDGDQTWVLCGDSDEQAGIAALSGGFRNLDWLRRGDQSARAVGLLVSAEALTYGTDSDRERNFIVRLEKESGRLTRLLEVEGSSLYATSFGALQLIATTVEPNPRCPSPIASLYGSLDGERWERLRSFRKDAWHPTLFQFGTIVLPASRCALPHGAFSGQALQGFDDRMATLTLTDVPERRSGEP